MWYYQLTYICLTIWIVRFYFHTRHILIASFLSSFCMLKSLDSEFLFTHMSNFNCLFLLLNMLSVYYLSLWSIKWSLDCTIFFSQKSSSFSLFMCFNYWIVRFSFHTTYIVMDFFMSNLCLFKSLDCEFLVYTSHIEMTFFWATYV